jgi:hypothetical protein
VSPVKYELGSYITGDGILHSHCREGLKSSPELTPPCSFFLTSVRKENGEGKRKIRVEI